MLGRIVRAFFRNDRQSVPQERAASKGPEFVAFVTSIAAPHCLAPGETLESDQASMRLRVGIPARELAHRVPVWLVPPDYLRADPELARLGAARAIVLGKVPVRFVTQDPVRAMDLAAWAESAGRERCVVADFSDDFGAAARMYSKPELLEFQTRMLAGCHATVPSEALRVSLSPFARHGISVIEDPYESPQAAEPRFAPGPVLRLVWFGVFAAELRPFIEAQLAAIARRLPVPVELAFVTYAAEAQRVNEMAAVVQGVNARFTVRHVTWSLAASARELARADIVVLPQDAASAWGRVKSHNRLVEAIRGGRFAVASPIPSYLELASHAWVDDDLAAGIEWALGHPQHALQRIREGQAYVANRFAPERIGEAWAGVLGIR